jgi:S-methylmethionine-dependent homocysteine/selenocysteine methylase
LFTSVPNIRTRLPAAIKACAHLIAPFVVEVRVGAGAYVCGEETSLLNSLEGKRGEVRAKPPLPALEGLFGKPTVVNNVLTLAAVPWIMTHGGEAYAAFGMGRSKGTMPVQFAGNVKNGGLFEVAFGITLGELVNEIGGGTDSGRPVRCVQVGGPLGAYIPPSQFDLPFDYEAFTAADALIGHAGITVFDDSVDMAQMARFAMEFCAAESCGKCTPCRLGSTRGVETIDQIIAGKNVDENLELIADLHPLSSDERDPAFPRGLQKVTTILDGGMGRELQRLGAPFRQPEWSALALLQGPEYVTQAHEGFARAGANMISTNSYAIVPFHIGDALFAERGLALAGLAGQLARDVADRHGVRVAGSLPPVLGSYRPDLFEVEAARAILTVLIEGLTPFADVWLAETLSSLGEAELVGEMLAADSRPLWLSFTLNDEGSARLRSGESIEAAVALAQKLGAAALLFNCSAPEVMEDAVARARAAMGTDAIEIGVYANGFAHSDTEVPANGGLRDIRADLDPPRYLEWARKWVAAGATMVGGCCGIGPQHIQALAGGLR